MHSKFEDRNDACMANIFVAKNNKAIQLALKISPKCCVYSEALRGFDGAIQLRLTATSSGAANSPGEPAAMEENDER